jgi:hypothetical protein|mmetsp:Transcript_105289/g.164167  ORF Transcript_105289/g.164167 Transcript_105289/m.164167 type:complete len:228 (+) Transcript_105289:2-685(+)
MSIGAHVAKKPSHAVALFLLALNPGAVENYHGNRFSVAGMRHKGHLQPTPVIPTRREALAALAGIGLIGPHIANAEDSDATTIVRGRVTLQQGAGDSRDTGALYVSVKQVSGFEDVLKATRGSGSGSAPPIAVARYPAPVQFPFDFVLRDADLTPEGTQAGRSSWGKKDLVVTVRYDVDGVAATRNADDLVGQVTVLQEANGLGPANVEIKGRNALDKQTVTKALSF